MNFFFFLDNAIKMEGRNKKITAFEYVLLLTKIHVPDDPLNLDVLLNILGLLMHGIYSLLPSELEVRRLSSM